MIINSLKYEIPTEKINYEKNVIEIKHFLPTMEKSKLIDDVVFYCCDERAFDKPILDAVLNAMIALNYTDIQYDYKTLEDIVTFFDYLEVNGLMKLIINNIPDIEYNSLISYFRNTMEELEEDF